MKSIINTLTQKVILRKVILRLLQTFAVTLQCYSFR